MRLGKAIKWIREQRGYFPTEFCRKIDMPTGQYWRIENSEDQIRPKSINKVAKGLEVDVEVFYYLTLLFTTDSKMNQFNLDSMELLKHDLKKNYDLDLDITIGI